MKSVPAFKKKGRISPSRGPSGGRAGCALLDHLFGTGWQGARPRKVGPVGLCGSNDVRRARAPDFDSGSELACLPSVPIAAVSPASRPAIACSSFGKKWISVVAAAPAAAPSGLRPCCRARNDGVVDRHIDIRQHASRRKLTDLIARDEVACVFVPTHGRRSKRPWRRCRLRRATSRATLGCWAQPTASTTAAMTAEDRRMLAVRDGLKTIDTAW